MLEWLSAYVWGTAAGFDSLVCQRGEATLICLHTTSTCISTLLSGSRFPYIALSICGPFPPFTIDFFSPGFEGPASFKMYRMGCYIGLQRHSKESCKEFKVLLENYGTNLNLLQYKRRNTIVMYHVLVHRVSMLMVVLLIVNVVF